MPVEDHPVHERTRRPEGAKYGCFNRTPFNPHYLTKAGFSADGRQLFRQVPHVLSNERRYDRQETDASCGGCKWQK